jgi:hypothetical protein
VIETTFGVLIGGIPNDIDKKTFIVDSLLTICETERIRVLAAREKESDILIRAGSRAYKIHKLSICVDRILEAHESLRKSWLIGKTYEELCLDLDVFFFLLRELYDNTAQCICFLAGKERIPRSFSDLKKKVGQYESILWPEAADLISSHESFDEIKAMRDAIAHHSTRSLVIYDNTNLFIAASGLGARRLEMSGKYAGPGGNYYRLLPTLAYYINSAFGFSEMLARKYIEYKVSTEQDFALHTVTIVGRSLPSLHTLSKFDDYWQYEELKPAG